MLAAGASLPAPHVRPRPRGRPIAETEYREGRKPTTDLQTLADRFEIEALRGRFTDAVMMRDYGTLDFLSAKFASKPEIRDANITAFKAGYAFGETTEVFAVTYEVAPALMPPGKYRQISGNLALAYGLITASRKAGLPLFLGAYPIMGKSCACDVVQDLAQRSCRV